MLSVKKYTRGPGGIPVGKPAIHPASVDLRGRSYESVFFSFFLFIFCFGVVVIASACSSDKNISDKSLWSLSARDLVNDQFIVKPGLLNLNPASLSKKFCPINVLTTGSMDKPPNSRGT